MSHRSHANPTTQSDQRYGRRTTEMPPARCPGTTESVTRCHADFDEPLSPKLRSGGAGWHPHVTADKCQRKPAARIGENSMSVVDAQQLRAKVKEMYKAVAEQPHGTFHFEMGRE